MSKLTGFRSRGIAIGITVLLGLLVNTASSAVSNVDLYQTGSWSDFPFSGAWTTSGSEILIKTVNAIAEPHFLDEISIKFLQLMSLLVATHVPFKWNEIWRKHNNSRCICFNKHFASLHSHAWKLPDRRMHLMISSWAHLNCNKFLQSRNS